MAVLDTGRQCSHGAVLVVCSGFWPAVLAWRGFGRLFWILAGSARMAHVLPIALVFWPTSLASDPPSLQTVWPTFEAFWPNRYSFRNCWSTGTASSRLAQPLGGQFQPPGSLGLPADSLSVMANISILLADSSNHLAHLAFLSTVPASRPTSPSCWLTVPTTWLTWPSCRQSQRHGQHLHPASR